MNRKQVAKFFEDQNLNLECITHVRAAHAVLTEFGCNPPALKTMLNWKRA
jgi:hypothetical protein